MVATQDKIQNPADLSIGDELFYINPDELSQLKMLGQLTNYYIRKHPSQKEVDQMVNDLKEVRDGVEVAEVTEAWVLWIDPKDGQKFIINGNTRYMALIQLRETNKAIKILPIPYRLFLLEPTPANLIKYQRLANDTTNPHHILDIARSVCEYKQERETYYISQGVKSKEAQRRSTEDLNLLFPGYDKSYISRLKTLNSIPDFAKDCIKNDEIAANAMAVLAGFHTSPKKKNQPLDDSFKSTVEAFKAWAKLKEFDLPYGYNKADSWVKTQEQLLSAGETTPDGEDAKGDAVTPPTVTNNTTKPPKGEDKKSAEEVKKMMVDATNAITTLNVPSEIPADSVKDYVELSSKILGLLGFAYPKISQNVAIGDITLSDATGNKITISKIELIRELAIDVLADTDKRYDDLSSDGDKTHKIFAGIGGMVRKIEAPAKIKDSDITEIDKSGEVTEEVEAVVEESDEVYTPEIEDDIFTIQTEDFIAEVS